MWPPLTNLTAGGREIPDFHANIQGYLVEFLFDQSAEKEIKGINNLDDYIENPTQFVKRYKSAQYDSFFAPDNQGQVKVEKLKKGAKAALNKIGEMTVFEAITAASLTDNAKARLGMGSRENARKAILAARPKTANVEEPTDEEIDVIIAADDQELKSMKIKQILQDKAYRDAFIGYQLDMGDMKVPDESNREYKEGRRKGDKKIPIAFFEEMNNLRKKVMDGDFTLDDADLKTSLKSLNPKVKGKLVKDRSRKNITLRYQLETSDAEAPTQLVKDKLTDLGFRLSDWEIDKVRTRGQKKTPDSFFGSGAIKELSATLSTYEKQFPLLFRPENKPSFIKAMEGKITEIEKEFTIEINSKDKILFTSIIPLEVKLKKVQGSKSGNPFTWISSFNDELSSMLEVLLEFYTDRLDYLEEDKAGAMYLFRTQFGNEELTEDDYTDFYEHKAEVANSIESEGKINLFSKTSQTIPLNPETYQEIPLGKYAPEDLESSLKNLITKGGKGNFEILNDLVRLMKSIGKEVTLIVNQGDLGRKPNPNNRGRPVPVKLGEVTNEKGKVTQEGVAVSTYDAELPKTNRRGGVVSEGKLLPLLNALESGRKEFVSIYNMKDNPEKLRDSYTTSKQLSDLFAMMGVTMGEPSAMLGSKGGKMNTIEEAHEAIETIKSRQAGGKDIVSLMDKVLMKPDGVFYSMLRKSPFVNLLNFGMTEFTVELVPVPNERNKMVLDVQAKHFPKGNLKIRYTKQTTYQVGEKGQVTQRNQLERGKDGKVGLNPFRRRWLLFFMEKERQIQNAIGM
tara:strand:- start:47990 stop:50368 length:2379 start_codon:yes stop_codon:yes gene_type:complete